MNVGLEEVNEVCGSRWEVRNEHKRIGYRYWERVDSCGKHAFDGVFVGNDEPEVLDQKSKR